MKASVNHRTRVLVVEDDDQTALNLAALLAKSDSFACLGRSECAEDAIRHASDLQPDAVLYDLQLQQVVRPETIARIKQVAPRSRVLVLTSYEDSDLIVKSLAAGADGYILKSDTTVPLLLRLRCALEDGAPISRAVARKILQHFRSHDRAREVSGFGSLTPDELEILRLLVAGFSNRQIATRQALGYEVLKSRIERIFEKLRVKTRTEAAHLFGLHSRDSSTSGS